MRKLMLIVAMSTLLSACGARLGYVDPAFSEYVSRFEILSGVDTSRTSITFGELKDAWIGECTHTWGARHGKITIDKSYWDKSTDTMRESLIFHELGHCSLDRNHDNTKFSDRCARSIMHEYSISEKCYRVHRDWYIIELFQGVETHE